MVTNIESSEHLKKTLEEAATKLVVIDFYATWCGPCKMIAPKVEELATQMQDVVFLKVNVDDCDEIVVDYEISTMPTFVFIRGGKVLESFSGANYDKLLGVIQKHK